MIIFALILIVFIVMIFAYEYDVLHIHDLPICSIRDLPLNTGDIFITRCDYVTQMEPVHYAMFGLFNHIATGGFGTHAGIIVKFNDTPYIYHAEFFPTYDYATGAYRWKAPVLMDYCDYFMKYCGEIIYYPIRKGLNADRTQEFIMSQVDREFTINQFTWVNTILKVPLEFNKDHTICTKLVTDYLDFMNVLKVDQEHHQVSPHDLSQYLQASSNYHSPKLILNAYVNYKKYRKKMTII